MDKCIEILAYFIFTIGLIAVVLAIILVLYMLISIVLEATKRMRGGKDTRREE